MNNFESRFLPPAIALLLCSVLFSGSAAAQNYVPAFRFMELQNGLRVVLHRDTAIPIVSLTVAYRAGSSRDTENHAGTAYLAGQLFPSLTSKFSTSDFIRMRSEIQAGFSAQTGVDWTSIASVFPSSYLDSALQIEADRMANAAQQLDTAVFRSLRDRNAVESRKRFTSPLGKVDTEIYHLLYPEGHPYRRLSSGVPDEIDSITYKDVAEFLRKYYCPANATLTIAGNFDTLQVKALIESHFASIPAGIRSQWKRTSAELPPLGKVGFISEEYVNYHRLMLVFPTNAATHPDDPVLKLVGSVLAGSPRASLTYLLKRRPEVLSVEAYQSSQELAGEFWISVTCQMDADLNKIYKEIQEQLKILASSSISAEQLQAAKNATEFSFLLPVQNLSGFGGRGDLLNLGALLTGDPAFVFTTAARRQQMTAADVRAAIRKYLDLGNVAIISIVPSGKREFAVTF